MANCNPGYSLFRDETGWETSTLPSPYCAWGKISTDPAVMSVHNRAKWRSVLHRWTIHALMEYAAGNNSKIGVVQLAEGSYASEWTQPDGGSIIAHATSNGVLSAGIRDPLTGETKVLPNLGSLTQVFNDASILILYMLIEADINAKNGVTEHAITHDLLRTARDDFAVKGEISENVVRLVCDDLYYALSYGEIPVNIKAGAISLLKDRRINNGEFSNGTIICGMPNILTYGRARPSTPVGDEARHIIKCFAAYLSNVCGGNVESWKKLVLEEFDALAFTEDQRREVCGTVHSAAMDACINLKVAPERIVAWYAESGRRIPEKELIEYCRRFFNAHRP